MSNYSESGGFVPGFIRRDFLRKFIALFFAGIVFWKVSKEIGIEETIDNVKLNIVTQGDYAVLGSDTVNLKITVRVNDQETLLNLSPSDFKFTMEIPEPKNGIQANPLDFKIMESAKIVKPLGVEILSVRPDNISVSLDEKTSRELPVKVRFSGAVQDNYTCGEVYVIPEKVTVTGPKTMLGKLRDILTDPVILDERTIENFKCKVKLSVPEEMNVVPRDVVVQVEVYKKIDTRKFTGIPIDVLVPANSSLKVSKISPTNVDITVQGIKGVIEKMKEAELKPFIDISSIDKAGTIVLKPLCFIDLQGVRMLEYNPTEIRVDIIQEK